MTIRDISERGNQDKLVLIVFDMRNVVEEDNLENIREKQPVNRSHGSGEWYRGNNVYQGLVGNNWDIMGSVTSCLGNKVGVICHLMMGRWCLSVSLVSTSLCADCQHLIVCNFRRGRGCTVSSTHIFSLEESFCHHVKIYLAEKQQEFTTGRGTLCCNSDLWQFLLMYHDVFIVLTLHVGYQQFVRKYYFCYLSNLCNYSPQSWASPIGSGHKIVLLQLNY